MRQVNGGFGRNTSIFGDVCSVTVRRVVPVGDGRERGFWPDVRGRVAVASPTALPTLNSRREPRHVHDLTPAKGSRDGQ